MVRSCSAYGCSNEWKPNGVHRFHRFPIKRPEILKLWIQAVRLKDFQPNANTVLCSEHFTDNCYLESSVNKNILKKDAVPSIFKFPEHLQKKLPVRRKLVRQPFAEPQVQSSITHMEITASVSNTSDIGTQTSPKRLKKSLTEIKLKRKLKTLQQKLNRRDAKIWNMRDLIKCLKVNNKSNSDLEDVLRNNFEGFSLELFKNESANANAKATQRRYTQDMKQFALTLYFYSPKAYKFLRSKIHKNSTDESKVAQPL